MLCFYLFLFVWLFVCPLDYWESYERILVTFFGGVGVTQGTIAYRAGQATLRALGFTFPLPSLPFPPLPFLFPSLLLPFRSFPFPSLSLEVGPLNTARRSGECCKLPQWGLGWSPSGNRICCILTRAVERLISLIALIARLIILIAR